MGKTAKVENVAEKKPRTAGVAPAEKSLAKRTDGTGKVRKRKRPPVGRGPQGDVALVVGPTDDRKGYQILRKRSQDAPVEMGTVRPLEEGRPIHGEVIGLAQRKDFPFMYDVKTDFDARRDGDGPPKVATEEYRRGWEAIWGERPRDEQLN